MPERKELASWKAIGAYLGVNIRTAQKYERERGLPVRRLPGGHGRVAADATAIDRWRDQPTLPAEATSFRLPVDRDMIAEVRLLGGHLSSKHLERLIEHLTLIKNALE